MAFIRQYAGRTRGTLHGGDPFLGKFFKRAAKGIKRIQPGKLVKKYGKHVVGLLPGGPVMADVLEQGGFFGGGGERPMETPAEPVYFEPPAVKTFTQPYYPEYDEPEPMQDPRVAQLLSILAALGFNVGDPKRAQGTPRKRPRPRAAPPRAGSRRKAAAAGGRAKARTRGKLDIGALLQGGAGLLRGVGGLTKKLDPALMGLQGMQTAQAMGLVRSGGRRTMNPANVKALRRSLRRVEGFEKLVKRVHKMYPRLRAASSAPSRGRARGHRAGCRCVGCRAA